MRKIFKSEELRKDNRIVKIPDIEFNVPDEESEDKEKEQLITKEFYEKALSEVRNEYSGEIGRKKLLAQQECNRMIHNAKKEAEKIVSDAGAESGRIISEAKKLSDQIKLEAYNEGRKNGLAEKSDLLENLSHYISQSIEEIKAEQNEYFEAYSKEIRRLAIEICEKVIFQKIEEDDMLMYNVIKNAVKSVRDAKWIKASVSSQLSGYIDSLEKELNDAGENVEFVLSESVPKDTCVLNTSNGLVEATISTQLNNLKEFIYKLDKGDSNEDLP